MRNNIRIYNKILIRKISINIDNKDCLYKNDILYYVLSNSEICAFVICCSILQTYCFCFLNERELILNLLLFYKSLV